MSGLTVGASRRAWEPPWSQSRVAGGLLGVIGGEIDAWGGGDGAVQGCPVASALMDVARGYASAGGDTVPVDVATRHQDATAPGWLLPVALVRSRRAGIVADALELATSAGVPRRSLGVCVAWVELAAALFAGRPVVDAIRSATGGQTAFDLLAVGDGSRAAPPLCGESAADALSAGVWALLQDEPIADVVAAVGRMSTPAVAGAVAGLLGVRDGCGELPCAWHRCPAGIPELFGLAAALVRSRGPGRAGAGRRQNVGVVGNVDVVAGGGPGVGVAVAAYAITEEIRAVGGPAPSEAVEGVARPGATAAGSRPPGPATQRQLEGAGLR